MKPILLALTVVLLLGSCSEPRASLTVAVAANLSAPLQVIVARFEAGNAGQKVQLVVASSGVLTAQIRNGAPFDVFLSADEHYPKVLASEGLALLPPRIFTRGRLVLWTRDTLPGGQLPLDPARFSAFAIANPELAPYGLAAKNWLVAQGKWDSLFPHIIYGENVGQVNQYIRSGTVDGALTAVSARHAPELQHVGYWTILPADATPGIPHAAVLLKSSDAKAKQFWDFLFSADAQKVFESYGYDPITP